MLKVLVCVVPGLFPPERQVTQLCVKLSVMYMDMRRADINDDQMQTAKENAIAFKDQALLSLAPVLDKVSRGVVKTTYRHVQTHILTCTTTIQYILTCHRLFFICFDILRCVIVHIVDIGSRPPRR